MIQNIGQLQFSDRHIRQSKQSKKMIDTAYQSYSYTIFGHEKVGKTNIINRLIKDEFQENYKQTLEGQQTTTVNIDGKIFEIHLFDTGGQTNLRTMQGVWRENKNGFIFAFAIDCESSFWRVVRDIRQVKQRGLYRDVAIILVGNKIDLEQQREVDYETAAQFAASTGIKYFQISAKDSHRSQINSLICQLVDTNEMTKYFNKSASRYKYKFPKNQPLIPNIFAPGRQFWNWNWNPCEDSLCQIM